jgi:hypothetical protein
MPSVPADTNKARSDGAVYQPIKQDQVDEIDDEHHAEYVKGNVEEGDSTLRLDLECKSGEKWTPN